MFENGTRIEITLAPADDQRVLPLVQELLRLLADHGFSSHDGADVQSLVVVQDAEWPGHDAVGDRVAQLLDEQALCFVPTPQG